MKNKDACFSSEKTDWETPQDLFDELDEEFHFDLDCCATAENTKCEKYITPEQDALLLSTAWPGVRVWMNPPYGRDVDRWVEVARYRTFCTQDVVVCLLPARTDTKWWHTWIWDRDKHRPYDGVEVRFLKGRVKFVGAKASAPFPSVIVIFRGNKWTSYRGG